MIINNVKPNLEHHEKIAYWILLSIIIIIIAWVRIRLLEIPLERDEGEYAYCGQLLLQMVPPFKSVYSMKLPGTSFVYALIMLLCGQTIRGIHLGLLFANGLSIILLFLILERLLNPRAALFAALSFAILSLSPTVLGFAAHATHFIILAALAGTYLLFSCLENGRLSLYWLSGFFFGLAFIMKQPGIFLALWGGLLILQQGLASTPLRIKALLMRLAIYGSGAVFPLILVALLAILNGSFGKFWFWTFKYSAIYASAVPLSRGMEELAHNLMEVVNGFALLWIMAAAGFPILIFDRRLKKLRWSLITFSLFSLMALGAGFYFRNHYFILILPATAMLIGICLDFLQYYISRKCSSKIITALPLLTLFIGIIGGVYAHREYFFSASPRDLAKAIHGPNPSLESLKIAEFLRSRTSPADKIAVLGSEPQIFFYAQRKSATAYIYVYEMMRNHHYSLSMQEEMIGEIERAAPKFIVLVKIMHSWLIQPDSKMLILKWFNDYSRQYYRPVGRVDIIPAQKTRYLWGDEAGTAKDESPYAMVLYERR